MTHPNNNSNDSKAISTHTPITGRSNNSGTTLQDYSGSSVTENVVAQRQLEET
jgi:hypothetical protein